MKLCAHTMGTPEHDVFRAAELFAEIGYAGMEIICHDDYRCAVNVGWPAERRNKLRRHLRLLNLQAVCLTPYLKTINSPEASEQLRCMEEAKQVVQLAHDLEFTGIRILAGLGVPEDQIAAATHKLVEALGELGHYARQYGVELWVENHMDSLAVSGATTADIVRRVNLPNVGIIYDPGNLLQLKAEPFPASFHNQQPYIRHIHVKDGIATTQWEAKTLGNGEIDWPAIMKQLHQAGFTGYLCYEYERRWVPDLPPAEIGMREAYAFIINCLSQFEQ